MRRAGWRDGYLLFGFGSGEGIFVDDFGGVFAAGCGVGKLVAFGEASLCK